jgi:MinD-like ATPase involved in chromosome partitioning or flagellar assembly
MDDWMADDKKPYIILAASQKGGVGKTTIAVNLAVALLYHDYDVLLVDSDTATFSIKEHLGIKGDLGGYKDAVSGKVPVSDSIFAYQPIDLHLILGNPSQDVYEPTPDNLNKFYSQLSKLNYDFVIIDAPPGFFNPVIAKYVDDVAIVTTPDSPSVVSSAKLSEYCDKFKLRRRLIINRAGYSKYELDKSEVEKLFGDIAYATMPDDKTVAQAMSMHKPIYLLDKGAPFSAAIDEFCRAYMLRVGEPAPEKGSPSSKGGFFSRLAGWSVKADKK